MAGQERFRSVSSKFCQQSDGVILAFSLCDRSSFEHVRSWLDSIKDHMKEDACQIMIGNKADSVEERKIEKQEAEELAKSIGMRYYETSAK